MAEDTWTSADYKRAGVLAGLTGVAMSALLAGIAWLTVPTQIDGDLLYRLAPPQPDVRLEITEADALAQALDHAGLTWPPGPPPVPTVVNKQLPTDMAKLDPHARRALFLRLTWTPAMLVNRRIEQERQFVVRVTDGPLPRRGTVERHALDILAARYDVATSNDAFAETLLRRIDVVPAELVMATAAIQSAWGISSMAVRANALFGEWTDARPGKPAAFGSLSDSIESFMHHINTAPELEAFREERERQRESGAFPELSLLAARLAPVSPRGTDFARDIDGLIQQHTLHLAGTPSADQGERH